MDTRRARRKRNLASSLLPVAAFGLVLAAAALLLRPSRAPRPAADPSDYSTIPLPVSFPAPQLTLTDVHGQSQSLTDYLDRVVILNNWAIWCPPCKAEMPTLQAYYQAHASEGLSIVAIEAGDPEVEVLKFVESHGLQFPVWTDPHKASLRAFGNFSLPNSYVIDRTGQVRLAWVGEISSAMLEKYVTPMLDD